MSEVFGPIIGSYDVEQAVLAVLEEWLPTYLAEVARVRGIDQSIVPRPRSMIQAKEFEGWPEDRLPCVQVVSPGLAERPERSPEGYAAWWQINVFCVVHGRDKPATRRLRGIYEDAITACLMQRPGLGGLATGMQWLGGGAGDVPIDERDTRTLAGAVTVMAVQVDSVLDPTLGPAQPDPLPAAGGSNAKTLDGLPAYPDDPTVATADVTVTPHP